jgi:hypothetical protein
MAELHFKPYTMLPTYTEHDGEAFAESKIRCKKYYQKMLCLKTSEKMFSNKIHNILLGAFFFYFSYLTGLHNYLSSPDQYDNFG